MTKPNVIITETLAPRCADWLAERANVTWCDPDDPSTLDAALPTAEALVIRTYTQVDPALLDRAPKLRVVGRAGVGLDNVDLEACRSRGIAVVYTPDANTQAVVEYVLAVMLDTLRPRGDMDASTDADAFHAMRKTLVGTQLDQLTLGIVGFGRIGKRLGAVAHAIGMNLRVNDLLPEVELRKAVAYPFDYVDKPRLWTESDIVTLHVDGRAANRRMIDARVFAQLKPDAMFINAARGMLIDHAALADWAGSHPDARAILDVHDPEPPPPDHPLHGLPNVRLLPHLASRTDIAMENMSWVVRDVIAVLTGDPPTFPAAS